MEENKDKRGDAYGIDDDTLIFRREPIKQPPTSGQRVPTNMQHTAQIQGGAVIRPLKKQSGQFAAAQQSTRTAPNGQSMPTQRTAQGQAPSQQRVPPQSTPRQTSAVQRPTGQAPTGQRPAGTVTPLQRSTPQKPAIQPQNSTQRTVAERGAAHGSQNTPSRVAVPPQSRPVNNTPYRTRPSQNNLPIVSPQAKRRGENDDFEIDEATYTRETKIPKRDSAFVDSATSAVMSLVKAVIYIVAIIAVSVGLAVFVINTGNDVFKFVVEEKIVTVEIPEYATIEDVADALYDAGAIKYKWAFNLWSGLKDSGAEFIPGTYEVSTSLNYDYLRATFKENTNKYTEVRITIPEGYTVDEIIELFVENGIGTREGFVDAIQNYDFDYPFLDGLEVSEDRIYRLEGYLFPDTYYFYKESSEATILRKMLDNFNVKFVSEYYARCNDLGLTVDEAIILASMVEKETRYADELGFVSSVFHNRLKYSATFPYLNSDATIMYAMQHDLGGRPDGMSGDDTEYETPYNTYTHKGLPPGPIANPGLNSIKYALYPNDTNYFYFVSDDSGRTLFATTEQEHLANINAVRGN